ncbi:MAG: hypothetical protein E5X67_17795 [Mesorhizobium sp.]|uniref:hypothetical protein n=1 Tax=Mesorhizobium sp. TaxID=1871066 RepID=UPI0012060FB3|nr:hypothetical protein [Mesorhizobium sp.]TIP26950.1 MAG: hypothetical protein E5X67_17795 [Mesorhizobium sp.]
MALNFLGADGPIGERFLQHWAWNGSFVALRLASSILFDLPGKGRNTAASNSDVGCARTAASAEEMPDDAA